MENFDLEAVCVGYFESMHTLYAKGKKNQSFMARKALKGIPVNINTHFMPKVKKSSSLENGQLHRQLVSMRKKRIMWPTLSNIPDEESY